MDKDSGVLSSSLTVTIIFLVIEQFMTMPNTHHKICYIFGFLKSFHDELEECQLVFSL